MPKPYKILFIHGFGSCGTGNKATLLQKHFGSEALLTPDLPVNPADCLQQLQELILTHNPVATVSSSLGAFYATWLNSINPLPAVVINPAVHAAETLQPHIGKHTHWCNGAEFELTADHINQLKSLQRTKPGVNEKYLVLLQENDEVLDYREAARFYRGQQVVIEPGGNHRFENLYDYMTMIKCFIEDNMADQNT